MNYSGQRGTKRLRVDEISFRDIVADSVEAKTISVTDAFTFPSVDGTVNQVMKTDGNGLVTWADGGGGGTTPSLQEVFDASGTTPTILSSEPLYFESNPADPSTNPLITTFKPNGDFGWTLDRSGQTIQQGTGVFFAGVNIEASPDALDPTLLSRVNLGERPNLDPYFQLKVDNPGGIVPEFHIREATEGQDLLTLTRNSVYIGGNTNTNPSAYTLPPDRGGQLLNPSDYMMVWGGGFSGTWVPLPMKFSQTVTTTLVNTTVPTIMSGPAGGGALELAAVTDGTSFIFDYSGDINTEQKNEVLTVDVLATNGIDPPVILASMPWTIDEVKASEPYTGRVKCTFTSVGPAEGLVQVGTVQGSLEHHTESGSRGGLLNSVGPNAALDTSGKAVQLSLAFTWTNAFPANSISIRQLTAYQLF